MSIAHQFKGKSVLVTGASAGIGRALGLALGRAGAHVGLVARREDRLRALVDEIGPSARATILVGDVSDEEFVSEAVRTFAAEAGGIDTETLRSLVDHLVDGGVHAIAPLGSTGESAYLSDEEWESVAAVTVSATVSKIGSSRRY